MTIDKITKTNFISEILTSICCAIVNREEGLEGRQTSKAFALIGFRC